MSAAARFVRDLAESELDWMAECEVEVFGPAAWSRALIDVDFHSGLRRYRGVEEEDSLVGYAVYGEDGDSFHLMNLVIIPSARGRGHARALMDDFLEEARHRGVRAASLEVAATNVAAIGLYRSFGFSVIRIRPRYYQPEDVDGLVMGLELVES